MPISLIKQLDIIKIPFYEDEKPQKNIIVPEFLKKPKNIK